MPYYQRFAKNKFGAKKTVYNGRKYDSKFEAGVSQEIDMLVRSGEVVEVDYQVTLPLYGKNGTKVCSHRPDFILTFKDGHKEIWEAKGFATDSFRIKAALCADNYPEYTYRIVQQDSRWYNKKR